MGESKPAKRTETIDIDGKSYTLSYIENPDNPNYIQDISKYMNYKAKQLKNVNQSLRNNELTFFMGLALNIADDFFKERMKRVSILNENTQKFNHSIEALQTENNDLKEKLKTAGETIAELKKGGTVVKLEHIISDYKEKNDELQNELTDIKNMQNDSNNIINIQKNKIADLSENLDKSISEITAAKEKFGVCTSSDTCVSIVEQLKAENSSLNTSISQLKEANEKLRGLIDENVDIERLEADIKTLQNEKISLNEEINSLKNDIDNINDLNNKILYENERLNAEIQQYNDKMTEYEDSIQLLQQQLNEKNKLIDEKEEKLNELQQQLDSKNKEYKAVNALLEKTVSESNNISLLYNQTKQDADKFKIQLDDTRAQLSNALKEVVSVNGALDKSVNESAAYNEKILEYESNIENINKQLLYKDDELKNIKEEFENIKNELETAKNEVSRLSVIDSNKADESAKYKAEAEALKVQLLMAKSDLNKAKSQLGNAKKELENYKK